jgi:hypothetical protein
MERKENWRRAVVVNVLTIERLGMGEMKTQDKSGIRLLLERYKALFRTAESRNYYGEEDCKKAERKFLKYALEQRRIEIQEKLFE